MKKFNKLFTEGTKVKLLSQDGFCTVKSVNENRNLIKVFELVGEFQRTDVVKFTNKQKWFPIWDKKLQKEVVLF